MTEPDAPGQDPLGDLPPDLPPEYAEAYRRGYERAWATSHDDLPVVPAAPAEAHASLDEYLFGAAEPEPWTGPTHRDEEEPVRQPGWLMPALIGCVVLALVLGAYGVGKLFSDSSPTPRANTTPVVSGGPSAPVSTLPAPKPVKGEPWDGPVRPLSGVTAQSSCTLPPSRDAAGRRVTYVADRALDGDFTTAWRCSGGGRGVTITLTLPAKLRLAEVGLVPGYAKTDAASGVDRYAENNRLTKVRWYFQDGRSVLQRLDGSARNRQVQTLRIPPVETGLVTLELLGSVRGPRNTVAISEIQLSEAVG